MSEEGGGRVQTLALELDVLNAASCTDRHANAVLKNANIEISDGDTSLIRSIHSGLLRFASRGVWTRTSIYRPGC